MGAESRRNELHFGHAGSMMETALLLRSSDAMVLLGNKTLL
jgi:hypothetical protein